MSKYMTVVLREDFKTDTFIHQLNIELVEKFGAPAGAHFVTRQSLDEAAKYYNSDPAGRKEWKHILRPLTPETLSTCFLWYRLGECHINLGYPEKQKSLAAVAIAQWISFTEEKFIAKNHSFYYTARALRQSLDYAFRQWGLNPDQVWGASPQFSKATINQNQKP